jgi:hypothetical protein
MELEPLLAHARTQVIVGSVRLNDCMNEGMKVSEMVPEPPRTELEWERRGERITGEDDM